MMEIIDHFKIDFFIAVLFPQTDEDSRYVYHAMVLHQCPINQTTVALPEAMSDLEMRRK